MGVTRSIERVVHPSGPRDQNCGAVSSASCRHFHPASVHSSARSYPPSSMKRRYSPLVTAHAPMRKGASSTAWRGRSLS